jgi:hypothetical protein
MIMPGKHQSRVEDVYSVESLFLRESNKSHDEEIADELVHGFQSAPKLHYRMDKNPAGGIGSPSGEASCRLAYRVH